MSSYKLCMIVCAWLCAYCLTLNQARKTEYESGTARSKLIIKLRSRQRINLHISRIAYRHVLSVIRVRMYSFSLWAVINWWEKDALRETLLIRIYKRIPKRNRVAKVAVNQCKVWCEQCNYAHNKQMYLTNTIKFIFVNRQSPNKKSIIQSKQFKHYYVKWHCSIVYVPSQRLRNL